MKNLFYLATLIAVSVGLSSCCKMFGVTRQGYRTETRQVKTCGYDTTYETVSTGSKDGMTQTVEKRVQRYKTIVKKYKVPCTKCVRHYCPEKDCCGTTAQSTLVMASAQGSSGSPNIGLIPTMKQIAP